MPQSSANAGRARHHLRRYTFVLSSEFALERELILHLQQLGQYRTTESLRRLVLRGYQWRLGCDSTSPARGTAAPAWTGEQADDGQSLAKTGLKKRCWMYLSQRVLVEDFLSARLERLGADRRAHVIRDLAVDGYWLEHHAPAMALGASSNLSRSVKTEEESHDGGATSQAQSRSARQKSSRTSHTSTPGPRSESIAQNGRHKPLSVSENMDNPDRSIRTAPASDPSHGASGGPAFEAVVSGNKSAPSQLQEHWDSRPAQTPAPASASVADPVVVQGQPMQHRDRSVPSQASALAALMGGVSHK